MGWKGGREKELMAGRGWEAKVFCKLHGKDWHIHHAIGSQKAKEDSGFKYICIAIKALHHHINMTCTFLILVLSRIFEVLAILIGLFKCSRTRSRSPKLGMGHARQCSHLPHFFPHEESGF